MSAALLIPGAGSSGDRLGVDEIVLVGLHDGCAGITRGLDGGETAEEIALQAELWEIHARTEVRIESS